MKKPVRTRCHLTHDYGTLTWAWIWALTWAISCFFPKLSFILSIAMSIPGPQHCCVILVLYNLRTEYGMSAVKKSFMQCAQQTITLSLYGWQNKYSQSIGLIPNSSLNAWYVFGCPWKWKLRVIRDTLWYTWYLVYFLMSLKMRGMWHVTCIEYLWVSLHCIFWVSPIQRNTCYNDRSWYIFLSFSAKKKKDMR